MTTLMIAGHKTPIGVLQVVADVSGVKPVVVSSGWQSADESIARLNLTGSTSLVKVNKIDGLSEKIDQYFDGDIDALTQLLTKQPGGPFMLDAWDALGKVPAGTVVTYSDLASLAGRPSAVRAAASACARNLVAPFIPCHRVIRTDGSLGGYYYGLDKKVWLLNHEGISI